MTSNLKEKLPSILETALQANTVRGNAPVLSLGKEKYAEELCGHFIWKNGQQTAYLCPSAISSGTIFTNREEALKLQPELAEKMAALEQNDQEDPFASLRRSHAAISAPGHQAGPRRRLCLFIRALTGLTDCCPHSPISAHSCLRIFPVSLTKSSGKS